MIEILPGGARTRSYRVRLGEPATFDLIAADPAVEVRGFVQQQAVRYLKPLSDWGAPRRMVFHPESPGTYALAVEWRAADASHGWAEQRFDAVIGGRWRRFTGMAPRRVRIRGGARLWAPSEWEAAVFTGHEGPARILLPALVRPGATAYDVGANIGFHTILLSRLVGRTGHVIAVEANPLCIYFLRINMQANAIDNCTILPAALGDEDADVRFAINYGNSLLGLADNSAFYADKVGHEFSVHGHALDHLIESLALPPPDFVKMDIEGGEGPAVHGMRAAIARYRPTLLIEIHGRAAAEATVASLAGLGYRFRDAEGGATFEDERALMAWFPEAVRQIACTRAT